MLITIFLEKSIKESIPKSFFDDYNVQLVEIKKDNIKNSRCEGLIILLTEKILSREKSSYKDIINYLKNKNNKMIEVAFKKSRIESKKSYSNSIIYGFEDMTLNLVLKIIKYYDKNYDTL